MSRNFENEYRNFMADEVPDLWSRIEGNLKEKEPVAGYITKEVATNQKEKRKKQEFTNERNKKVTSIYVKKYAVAACLCVVILVGGGIAVYKSNVQRFNDTSRVIDLGVTKEAMDCEMSEDVAPMEESDMAEPEMETPEKEEAGLNDAEMDESAMVESETVFDEVYDESSLNEQLNQIIANRDDVEQNKEQMDSTETTEKEELENDTSLNYKYEVESETMEETSEEFSESNKTNVQAVVKIISIEDTGEETLYYVQVLPSVYSVFEPGTELVLCSGDMDISEPEMGVAYDVELEQLLDTQTIQNEIIYMIKTMEKQVE